MPTLQADMELRRCIDSIRLALPDPGQCEIVVVLPARHLQQAARVLEGVRLVAETRRGVYGAMNDGMAASTGRYLYFVGKDDILLPAAADIVRLLAAEAPRLLFADVYWGDEGVRRGRTTRWLVLFRNVCQQGIIYSREAVQANGPFLRQLRVQADHLLNIRALWEPAARGRVRYVAKPLAWYSATGLSFQSRDTTFHKVHAAVIARYLGPVAGCLWRAYKRVRPEKMGPG